MGKRSKSKRFTQQGADSIKKHAERFPYRSTLAERNRQQDDQDTLGGF
ncbi:hypothetical protein [Oceanobacillus halophilus]|nr:hypothetical protein [Oceanobacillus halophilus]